MSDFTRTMAPETAVKKAKEALGDAVIGIGGTDAVATLAAAMMIREGLIAVAKTISEAGGRQDDVSSG